jgi:hypothetical protein
MTFKLFYDHSIQTSLLAILCFSLLLSDATAAPPSNAVSPAPSSAVPVKKKAQQKNKIKSKTKPKPKSINTVFNSLEKTNQRLQKMILDVNQRMEQHIKTLSNCETEDCIVAALDTRPWEALIKTFEKFEKRARRTDQMIDTFCRKRLGKKKLKQVKNKKRFKQEKSICLEMFRPIKKGQPYDFMTNLTLSTMAKINLYLHQVMTDVLGEDPGDSPEP